MRTTVQPSRALLAALVLAGCGSKKEAATHPLPKPNDAAVVVQAARVGDLSQTVLVTGSLVAFQDVPLSAKQPGRLVEVLVREGDVVREGQALARVDPRDLESQVRADEATVTSDRAKVEQAQAAHDQQLADTEASIASAQAALHQQTATSIADVGSAQAQLASAKAALSTSLEGARPQERAQTEASLASSEASYRKSEADLKRYARLHAVGAVSDAEYDQYVSSRDVALADLNSKKAALRLQQEGNRRQDVLQARETVRQAEESLRKAQAGHATDEVKRADLETARAMRKQNDVKLADVDAAKATLQEALDQLAIARQAVADAVVRAPIAGRVSERTAEPGQVVASTNVLLHVVSLDSVYFEPAIADASLASLRVGQPVTLRVDAYPKRAFVGTVTRIYPQSSSTTRATSLRVTLPNPSGLLRPNMFAQGRITTLTRRGVVQVPASAIVSKGEERRVFVVEGDTAHARDVTLGLTSWDGEWIEARGIEASAKVIVSGQNSLEDGQKVAAAPSDAAKGGA